MPDIQRHQSVFCPYVFQQQANSVDVIGAGDTGQRLSRHLAQLGVSHRVFDKQASEASLSEMQGRLFRDTEVAVSAQSANYNFSGDLSSVIYLCNQSSEAREQLVRRLERDPLATKVVFDVSSDVGSGKIHMLNPLWLRETRLYKEWAVQQLPQQSPETSQETFSVTSEYIAASAAFQLIRWFAISSGTSKEVLNRQIDYPIFPKKAYAPEAIIRVGKMIAESGLRIMVIGAGALGSRVGRHLGELRIPFELWDDDKVEAHNIANQAYGIEDIGKFKAVALTEMVRRDFGLEVYGNCSRFTNKNNPKNIVFVCPDNMGTRTMVWDLVKFREDVRLVIEGRMDPYYGKVYTAYPRRPVHLREYPLTFCKDEEAVDQGNGACRVQVSVGPTAECIASRMVMQLIRWFVSSEVNRQSIDNEIFDYQRPNELYRRVFV